MHDIAFIRCHRFGASEDKLAHQLALFFGAENVALCVDETRGVVDTGPWKKAVLTRDRATEIVDGYVPEDWGWRMGDLCHIAIAETFGGYDRQWLIEGDVHIPAGREADIFGRLSDIPADFAACALRPKKVKPMAEAVGLVLPHVEWGCVFAFNRLAARCVPELRQLRRDIAAAMRGGRKGLRVPNDEAVLSNLAVTNGWPIADLWVAAPDIFSHTWFDTNPPWLRREAESREGSIRVLHPVLDTEQLLRRLAAGDGHPQQYKPGRLGRILPHLTDEEREKVHSYLHKPKAVG